MGALNKFLIAIIDHRKRIAISIRLKAGLRFTLYAIKSKKEYARNYIQDLSKVTRFFSPTKKVGFFQILEKVGKIKLLSSQSHIPCEI